MNQPESQTFMPSIRHERRLVHTDEWQAERERAGRKLIERLDEIADAVKACMDDPSDRRAILPFINGKGTLVIGLQSEVNDLLAEYELPLARQSADEVRFVEATAQYFGRTS